MNAMLQSINNYWPFQHGFPSAFSQAVPESIEIQKPHVSPISTDTQPIWILPVIERILELCSLSHNWDDRGSSKLDIQVLTFSISILQQVMPPTVSAPSLIPLGNGGVQIIWSSSKGEIEMEVIRPNDAIIYHFDSISGIEREWRASSDFEPLAAILWTDFKS